MRSTRIRRPSLLAALVLSCLAPVRAEAAWPHDPNNGNLPLCTATNEQSGPAIAADGAGGAIVTWADYRAGSTQDIYAQRVSAAGVPLWTADGVAVCADPGFQTGSTVLADGAGGAFIAWMDARGGFDYDLYIQRVNAAGVPQWTPDGVALCTAIGDQTTVALAPDGAGGVFAAWQDDRVGGFSPDIYAQRVNGSGVPQWTADGVALCTAPGYQVNVGIVPDGAGGAILAWWDNRADSDIYAQRVNGSGVPQWTPDGTALVSGLGPQVYPSIVTDGVGGAIVAWADYRNGNYDIYAQRVNANELSLWTPNGVPLCTAPLAQEVPLAIPDGAGGAIVTWQDSRSGNWDVYARRVSASGAPLWTPNGVLLSNDGGYKAYPAIESDGAGGAIIAWQDNRDGFNSDVYAQRVSAAGALLWGASATAVSAAVGNQNAPKLARDGAGGAIVTWADWRGGPSTFFTDIYAQRIERFGQLGNPEPSIVQIKDVPNDQGGKVNLQWTASYLDAVPNNPIDEYWIWRQVPAATALGALRRGEALFEAGGTGVTPRAGALRATMAGAQVFYWEFVASQASHGFAGYSYTASTTSDSVAAGNPWTRFMVEAEQTSTGLYWGSAPDSGYSVDNLAPAVPAPFTGEFSPNTATLHWGPNGEPDFALYHLHRGTSAGFVPGPGNLVASQPDTGYADNATQLYYYKLAAMDIHGNLSGYALVLPQGTVGVPGSGLPAQVALGPAQPSVTREGAVFHYALPREARVSLALFDQQGRRVRDLVGALAPAGEHVASWDGRDQAGRVVPSGIYFCRLEVEGRTLVRRLATLR